MNKLCCILDADENYALRVSECFNSRHALPFEVRAFSEVEAYYECEKENQVELLIAGEKLYPLVRNCAAGQIICLSEQNVLMEGGDTLSIAKYQPCDSIIREVVSLYTGKVPFADVTTGSKGRLVSIYSPNGYCGRTTLSLALAHIKGQKQRVLYINLEEFSVLGLSQQGGTLSDVLYYYYSGGVNAKAKIMSVLRQGNGFDYIPPTTCAQDLPQLSTEAIIGVVKQLSDMGDYELIIMDVGNLIKEPWKLLAESDVILSPAPDTAHRQKKQNEFEKYLYESEMADIADRIVKVDMVRDEGLFIDGRINYPYLINSAFGRKVSSINV